MANNYNSQDDSAHNPAARQGDRFKKVEDAKVSSGAALAAAPVQQYRGVLTPKEVWGAFVNSGQAKGDQSIVKTFILGVAAGCYIAFGGLLAYSVGGQMQGFMQQNVAGLMKLFYGFFGLPFGLGLVVLTGADLSTGNFAYLPAALLEGRTTFIKLMVNWVVSYTGNLVGSLIIVGLTLASKVLSDNPHAATNATLYPLTAIKAKTSPNFGVIFARGIMCNWLVCLALWQAAAAQDVSGKLFGVLFPIGAFVAIGFDHCVANMFIIPMGLSLQPYAHGITVGTYIWKNQVAATLGNIVAALIFIVPTFYLAYGKFDEQTKGKGMLGFGGKKPSYNGQNGKNGKNGKNVKNGDSV